MSNRVIYMAQGNAFEIHIATKKKWWLLLSWPFFLFLFAVLAGISTVDIDEYLQLLKENFLFFLLYLLAILIFWTMWLFSAYTWVWNAFGKEIVRVETNLLAVKRDVLGLGLTTKTFQIHNISNLRAAGFLGYELYEWLGLSGETIAFDYEGQTHRFGIQLEEQEANKVVEGIKTLSTGDCVR